MSVPAGKKCLGKDCDQVATEHRPNSGGPIYCKRHYTELLERIEARINKRPH